MPQITLFRSRAKRLQFCQAEKSVQQLELWLGAEDIPQPELEAVLRAAKRRCQQAAPDDGPEPFAMITPSDNRAVMNWILDHSKRVRTAMRIWALLWEHLDTDGSGRILLGRQEIAEAVGVHPKAAGAVMRELEECGAILTAHHKVAGLRGRGVVEYYLNRRVGEFMRERSSRRELAQFPRPGLGFEVIDGGKD